MKRQHLAAMFWALSALPVYAQLDVVWSHPANNMEVAFSPNSALLASGGGGANIWVANNGRLFETLRARFDDSRSIAFSPSGQLIAGGSHSFNQNLNLWRVVDGLLVKGRITAHNNGVETLQFSPGGQTLATGGRDRFARLWSIPDLTLLRSFSTGGRVFGLAFFPDGSKIVAGGQFGASVWDVNTGAKVLDLEAGTDVRTVAVSPDGKLIAAGHDLINSQGESEDSTIRIWRASDGALVRTLGAPGTLGTLSIQFSPSSSFLAAGGDGGAYPYYYGYFRIWRVADGALALDEIQKDSDGSGLSAVESVRYSPDSKLIAFTRLDGLLTVIRNPFRLFESIP